MKQMPDFTLSRREEELLEMLWQLDRPMTSVDMTAEPWQRSWKNNYLQAMLKSLETKGLIAVCGIELQGKSYVRKFVPVYTKEEFLAKATAAKANDDKLPQLMMEFAKETHAKLQTKQIAAVVARMASDETVDANLMKQLERIIGEIKEK